MNRRMRQWSPQGVSLLVVPLLGYLSLVIYPILATVRLSFYKSNGLTPESFVGLQNYQRLAGDNVFREALLNTVIWTIVTMTVPVAIGLVGAAVLNSPAIRGRGLFRALMFLPTTMSLVTLGIMFSLLYNPIFGALNSALRAIGLGALTQDWLGNPNTVLLSLALAFSWQFSGLAMALFHAGIQQISPELYEAAHADGANAVQRFIHVTLPGIRPVLVVVITLTVIQSLRAFDLVFVMTKGGPDNSSNVLGFLMYTQAFGNYNQGYGAAIAVVILLLSLTFAITYLRRMTKQEAFDE